MAQHLFAINRLRIIVFFLNSIFLCAGAFAQTSATKTYDRMLELTAKINCDESKKSPSAKSVVTITITDKKNGVELVISSEKPEITFNVELFHEYILKAECPEFVSRPILINSYVKGKEDFTKLHYALEFFLNLYSVKKILTEELSFYSKEKQQILYVTTNEGNAFIIQQISNDNTNVDLKRIGGNIIKNINGSNVPLQDTKIVLMSDKNETLELVVTDQNGGFVFTKVPSDKNFLIQLAENDPSLASIKMTITDRNGNVVLNSVCDTKGRFKFNLLNADNSSEFKSLIVDDEVTPISLSNSKNVQNTPANKDQWSDVGQKKNKQLTIVENVFFDPKDFKITEQGKLILDKVYTVMITNPEIKIEIDGHTDSKGDATFNLQLSKKRAQSAVEYLTSKGIQKPRLTSMGYGEAKPVNDCSNGIKCTEDQHSENRRLEFIVKE